MKTRYWVILCFILALTATLYVTLFQSPIRIKALVQKSASPNLLAIQKWKTTNGANVYFVPTQGPPMVDVEVNFDAGSARDGQNPGLSHLCLQLLEEGAGNLNADDIAANFENHGAQYQVSADKDRAQLKLRSLNKPENLNPSVDVFAQLLANPTFSEANIAKVKNQTVVEIQRQLQNPNVVANHAFFQAVYQDHPYAHPGLGTKDSVAAITREDLIAFHKQFFVTHNAFITIVGDLSKKDAEIIANSITKNLPVGSKPTPLPSVPALTHAIKKSIPFSSEQMHVLMGQACATANDPDYFPLTLGNDILGGKPFNSRLFKDMRDKRGLVYNIQSIIMWLKSAGPFVIKLQTKNDQGKEAVHIIKEKLFNFIQEGPTEQEVLEAKQGAIRALPLEINTNDKIRAIVSKIAFYNLPLDFLNTYANHIEKVTPEKIKAVFQKRLQPDKMVLIMVGTSSD